MEVGLRLDRHVPGVAGSVFHLDREVLGEPAAAAVGSSGFD